MGSNKIKKQKHWSNAFTLAEVLITLGVIGVVAAVTMPTLVTNIQERVRKEQVRTVKYKLTKATDKMNSLGKIGHYDSTKDFVDELKNHLSIAKVCDSNHLDECWSGAGFTNANGSKTYTAGDLKTGKDLEALQFNSGATATMGIVTGDGTPIILVYGKDCQALDEGKTYTWSTVDGKPETNATAGCVSMVFDINGKKGPNKIGTDVRTMNSLLGMVNISYTALSNVECTKVQDELDLQYCYNGDDRFAGAIKACHDIGMHLPSMATLAQIATLQYGVAIDIHEDVCFDSTCNNRGYNNKTLNTNYSTPISSFIGAYWSSQEHDNKHGSGRNLYSTLSTYNLPERNSAYIAICLAD